MQLHQAIKYAKSFANRENKTYIVYLDLEKSEYGYVSEQQWIRDGGNKDKEVKCIDKIQPKNK